MSVLKAELKQLVTTEVGVRVEDALEEAKRGLAIFEGRHLAMADGAKVVESLAAVVDEEVQSGKFDLDVAGHIKRYLSRASNGLQNLAQQAANLRMSQAGKIQGFEQTVALLKNMVEAERTKADALRAAEVAPAPQSPVERVLGSHPMSIKELRLAEETVAPVQEAPLEVKKRRGRPPNARNT